MVDPTLGAESFCYLTTRGRVSERPHTIEIWFVLRANTVYVLSGGRERSDWVRNLMAESRVNVKLGDRDFEGIARVVSEEAEDSWARDSLVDKYEASYGRDLGNWKRNSLPVAIDLVGG